MSALALLSRRLPLPLPFVLLLALALAYALPGLVGHDPWKTEDAIGTGIVHSMLHRGQWLVPHLAGEPFLEDGPFYYWIAAAFAWITSPWLEMHDGARLASGLLVLLSLVLVRLSARELYGEAEGGAAPLALIGSLGLLVHAHENLGEIGLLTAQALSIYSIALARRRPMEAGVLMGLAWAAAFLSKGLAAGLIPMLTAILLPIAGRDWRARSYAASVVLAAFVAAAASALWLIAAHLHAGSAFSFWWLHQLRAVSIPDTGTLASYGTALSWASWPAWLIALWILWHWRSRIAQAGVVLPLVALPLAAGPILFTPEYREVNIMAMLVPLALLCSAGVALLPRGAANALAWFGAMTFSFFGSLVWLGWFAMMTGVPEKIARNFAKLEPGHVPEFHWLGFSIAAVFTLVWLFVLFRSERSPFRAITFWAAGVTLLWALIMTLWVGWIDYGKTYRPVALALKHVLPADGRCIASLGLGEAQRAAFDYHAGVVTLRAEVSGEQSRRDRCRLLLVQARPEEDDRAIGAGWKRIWEGNRPRDKERFRLYQRQK